jgi:hypothetical protein
VDLDRRVGHAQAGQLGGQGPAGGGRVGRGADDQDLGAGRVWRTWYSTIPRSVSSKRISGRVGFTRAVT